MKRLFFCLLIGFLLVGMFPASAAEPTVPENAARSYILMEAGSGEVLASREAHKQMEPASVTKIMTLLLVCEAVDAGQYTLEDIVTASEHACEMGGSQIWLEPGEQFTVGELIKTVAVVSANDSAMALAEFTAGSEEGFVEAMNAKAAYLGMTDSCFKNPTGLPAEGHLTSAYDIALMSRELLKHTWIKDYTTVWMDSIRDGKSELVNTNRLIKTYPGATGMKTGFTQSAKYCLSATAMRDGMELIAVVLGGETSALRFEAATALLNYGFGAYTTVNLLEKDGAFPTVLPVKNGRTPELEIEVRNAERFLLTKSQAANLNYRCELPDEVTAPIDDGQEVGVLRVYAGEEEIAALPITAAYRVEKKTYMDVVREILQVILCRKTA